MPFIVTVRKSKITNALYAIPPMAPLKRQASSMQVNNQSGRCVRWYVPAGPFDPHQPHDEQIPAGRLSSEQRAGDETGIWEYKLIDEGPDCPERTTAAAAELIFSDPVIIIDDN